MAGCEINHAGFGKSQYPADRLLAEFGKERKRLN
jgi:hypothetical protein